MNNNYVYFSAVKCFWSSINETIVTRGRFKGGGHTPPPPHLLPKNTVHLVLMKNPLELNKRLESKFLELLYNCQLYLTIHILISVV